MNKYLLCIIAALGSMLGVALWQCKIAGDKWKTAEANVKAYAEELSKEGSKSTALQLSVSQLEYFNDSILEALNDTRNELKIKDRNLEALQYIESDFYRVDTIVLGDTIFKEPSFSMDTIMGDEWYTLNLGLKYPSQIVVEPSFRSEKHVVVYMEKQTVNPPKKFFIARWFQKKHNVLQVEVVEKNPYMDDQKSKYVEIVK